MAKQKIYIPTYISSIDYKPARVLPRVFFYNGLLETDTFYIQDNYGDAYPQTSFPYFDNYLGNLPTVNSKSLLFNNEQSVYGETPINSLYSEYWSTYVNLLYNPKTRLINCSAIIPLANYFKLNLNDIVEWRGNYYHLRAINNYNLSNGECTLQLLGPIIADTLAYILPGEACKFDFIVTAIPKWNVTKCDDSITYYGVTFDTTASLSVGQVVRWGTPGELEGCYTLAASTASLDLTGSILYNVYNNCEDCGAPTTTTTTTTSTTSTTTTIAPTTTTTTTEGPPDHFYFAHAYVCDGSCNFAFDTYVRMNGAGVIGKFYREPGAISLWSYELVSVVPIYTGTILSNVPFNSCLAACSNTPATTTTTTAGTTTTTTTSAPTNYVVDIYDVECNNIDTVIILNSMGLVIGKFYATNELSGPVVNVISLTAASPDYFTNINTSGYNTCPDVPPL